MTQQEVKCVTYDLCDIHHHNSISVADGAYVLSRLHRVRSVEYESVSSSIHLWRVLSVCFLGQDPVCRVLLLVYSYKPTGEYPLVVPFRVVIVGSIVQGQSPTVAYLHSCTGDRKTTVRSDYQH